MFKLTPGFSVCWLVECRFGQVHAVSHPHGPMLMAEQRSRPQFLIQQAVHCQRNSLGLVSTGQPDGRRFDQGDNVGTVDRDDRYHMSLLVIMA
jgi:hypothetical protein